MIDTDLSGKTAIVTGGASGIGLAAVELFHQAGAKVVVNFLPDDPRGPEAVARLGGDGVIAAPGDVADPEDARRMMEKAIVDLGRLDILINNAGTAATVDPIPFSDLDGVTEQLWQTILSTNLLGAFRCVQAAAPALKESGGCVVNTASVSAFGGTASSHAYAASKAGLINLTRNLAKGLAPGVRVNAVAPGLTRTPLTDPWPEERKRMHSANTMLGRMVEPEEVAHAMLFLCTNKAVTGQTVVVDCGLMY